MPARKTSAAPAAPAAPDAAAPATPAPLPPEAATAPKPAAAAKPVKAEKAKQAVKPTKPAKPAVKAAQKAPEKAAAKPAPKAPRRAAPKAAAAEKPAPRLAKPRDKLVRDSFTMPQADFVLIDALKMRALGFRRPTKKSELLRAGLQALAAMSRAELEAALGKLVPLKTGRPKKGA